MGAGRHAAVLPAGVRQLLGATCIARARSVWLPPGESAAAPETVIETVVAPLPVDDDDCIQTRTITMKDGVQFLIDSDNNLYDINSHQVVGTYNPDTQSAIIN